MNQGVDDASHHRLRNAVFFENREKPRKHTAKEQHNGCYGHSLIHVQFNRKHENTSI